MSLFLCNADSNLTDFCDILCLCCWFLSRLATFFRTLDKQHLMKQLGNFDKLELQEMVIDALCFQLGIAR